MASRSEHTVGNNTRVAEKISLKVLMESVEIEEKRRRSKQDLPNTNNIDQDESARELNRIQEHNQGLESIVRRLEREINIAKEETKLSKTLHQKELNCRKKTQMEKEKLEAELGKAKTECKKTHEELEQLHGEMENSRLITNVGSNYTIFSYYEIQEATDGFHKSLMMEGDDVKSVYKGTLRQTTFAIKVFNSKSMRGMSELHTEVEMLSRIRHPNVVTWIGASPEAHSLVFEFLPNGSLEDRLICKNNSQPLSWKVRIRIAAEICLALMFLHMSTPLSVIHGDVKPSNILLDANFVGKLGNFSVSRLLSHCNEESTSTQETSDQGENGFTDQEFDETRNITIYSDIYAFGVLILCLVTGKHGEGIVKEVRRALDGDYLNAIIDTSASGWSYLQAKQLVNIGLNCCEENQVNHSSLTEGVWKVLEPLWKACFPTSQSKLSEAPPSYFICPIFQDIMMDPHVAADGYTYENEAIKGWFNSGHNTSPMTNSKLLNLQLFPNHALRSDIQQWLQLKH